MRLNLYQAETARIATQQQHILNLAKASLQSGRALSALEENGVLHALQILIENAIGKCKQLLKASGQPVPVSAQDAFSALTSLKLLTSQDLSSWVRIVGLRNRIVHDYMNISMPQVISFLTAAQEQFVVDFLLQDFSSDVRSDTPDNR
jgi:uncharacterized protein YutE (UPF0331/DUF86 family)